MGCLKKTHLFFSKYTFLYRSIGIQQNKTVKRLTGFNRILLSLLSVLLGVSKLALRPRIQVGMLKLHN